MSERPPFRKPDECDAETPSIYFNPDANGYVCRCTVCAQCHHHTGNAGQGHYWAFCKVTKQMEEFHFCCPDACELHPSTDREEDE